MRRRSPLGLKASSEQHMVLASQPPPTSNKHARCQNAALLTVGTESQQRHVGRVLARQRESRLPAHALVQHNVTLRLGVQKSMAI